MNKKDPRQEGYYRVQLDGRHWTICLYHGNGEWGLPAHLEHLITELDDQRIEADPAKAATK